jgi:hypothetical protein
MITLTGSFESLTGAGVGYVSLTLVNYGTNVPRLNGAGVLVNTTYQTSAGSNFSVSLWGNDAITPANTYYQVAYFSAGSGLIATELYQLNGSGTYDLSELTPVVASTSLPQGLASVAYSGSYADLGNKPAVSQSYLGVGTGSATVFTLTAPATLGSAIVYTGGVYQYPDTGSGGDYTIAYTAANTWTITFHAPSTPANGYPVVVVWC